MGGGTSFCLNRFSSPIWLFTLTLRDIQRSTRVHIKQTQLDIGSLNPSSKTTDCQLRPRNMTAHGPKSQENHVVISDITGTKSRFCLFIHKQVILHLRGTFQSKTTGLHACRSYVAIFCGMTAHCGREPGIPGYAHQHPHPVASYRLTSNTHGSSPMPHTAIKSVREWL